MQVAKDHKPVIGWINPSQLLYIYTYYRCIYNISYIYIETIHTKVTHKMYVGRYASKIDSVFIYSNFSGNVVKITAGIPSTSSFQTDTPAKVPVVSPQQWGSKKPFSKRLQCKTKVLVDLFFGCIMLVISFIMYYPSYYHHFIVGLKKEYPHGFWIMLFLRSIISYTLW